MYLFFYIYFYIYKISLFLYSRITGLALYSLLTKWVITIWKQHFSLSWAIWLVWYANCLVRHARNTATHCRFQPVKQYCYLWHFSKQYQVSEKTSDSSYIYSKAD